MNRLDLWAYILLGCSIVLSPLYSLKKLYYGMMVHGGEREPHPEAVVSVRAIVLL